MAGGDYDQRLKCSIKNNCFTTEIICTSRLISMRFDPVFYLHSHKFYYIVCVCVCVCVYSIKFYFDH